jgi:glycosyltransferase involved in cell wall biosynthesis
MERFILPQWIKKHNFEYDPARLPAEKVEDIKRKLARFRINDPEISVVIPAYNEEKDLLRTLSTIAEFQTKYKVELLVSNNNSKDRTQEIIDACGIRSVFAKNQGISYARQEGLEAAKGKYILNADSDSLYPVHWIDTLADPLIKHQDVSCSYATYSFIPSPGNSRLSLGLYELVAESFFKLKKKNRECVSVMGFNFAFRREDGLKVGGYEHNLRRSITGRSEDGWMALQLMKVGKLYHVTHPKARVWTSDRRLMMDGSLTKAFQNRAKKELKRIYIYFSPKHVASPDEKVL